MSLFTFSTPPSDDPSTRPLLISPEFFVPSAPPVETASPSPVPPSRLRHWGDRLAQLCFAALLGQDQPRVTWRRDAQGHDQYQVYDPHSQRSYSFDNAQAVRVWLEQRYYA